MLLVASRLAERGRSWRQGGNRMQSGEGHVADEPLRPKCARLGEAGMSVRGG